jgi:hypothetical protein
MPLVGELSSMAIRNIGENNGSESCGYSGKYVLVRDYHGCIRMYLDVYLWMMDEKVWIVDKSSDIHR